MAAAPPRTAITWGGAASRRTSFSPFFLGALLAVSFVTWAFASPLMSVADEPAHVVKAAAVWRGELRGRPIVYPATAEQPRLTSFVVKVPRSYASVRGLFGCFAAQPDVPADCAPGLQRGAALVSTDTPAGTYPPLYYALVGWPSRLMSAGPGVRLMRVVSALLAASLFTLGMWSQRRRWSTGWTIVAASLAATPLLHHLAGSVNPAGFEIAAGFATWASLDALMGEWESEAPLDRGAVAAFLVSSVALAASRTLSPLFLLVILLSVTAFAGWSRLRQLAADRRAWALAAVVGLVGIASAAQVVALGHLDLAPGARRTVVLYEHLVAATDDWFAQAVAVFGWLDVGPVVVAVWGWIAALGLLGGLVALSASLRRTVVVYATAVAFVTGNVVLAATSGVSWQGRYLLPVGVGVVVLAVCALSPLELPGRMLARLPLVIAVPTAVGQVASQLSALRRYSVGNDGPLDFVSGARWNPPGGWVPIFAAIALTWIAWLALAATHERFA